MIVLLPRILDVLLVTAPVASKKGQAIPNSDTLSKLFGYFKAMRTCHGKLRYFDWDGQVHLVQGKTDGQQGDPLEMLIFNLTIHNLWGRVLEKVSGGPGGCLCCSVLPRALHSRLRLMPRTASLTTALL